MKDTDDELTFWADTWRADAIEKLKTIGAPYEPLEVHSTYKTPEGEEYVTLYYRCPKLTDAGRCSIYDDRPSICREFVPASNQLCVFAAE
jgi:Fe-S-cluster containining protein